MSIPPSDQRPPGQSITPPNSPTLIQQAGPADATPAASSAPSTANTTNIVAQSTLPNLPNLTGLPGDILRVVASFEDSPRIVQSNPQMVQSILGELVKTLEHQPKKFGTEITKIKNALNSLKLIIDIQPAAATAAGATQNTLTLTLDSALKTIHDIYDAVRDDLFLLSPLEVRAALIRIKSERVIADIKLLEETPSWMPMSDINAIKQNLASNLLVLELAAESPKTEIRERCKKFDLPFDAAKSSEQVTGWRNLFNVQENPKLTEGHTALQSVNDPGWYIPPAFYIELRQLFDDGQIQDSLITSGGINIHILEDRYEEKYDVIPNAGALEKNGKEI